MITTENLDALHGSVLGIDAVASSLLYYAKALRTVGNELLSDDLNELADVLFRHSKAVDKATAEIVVGQLHDTEQSSRNMLEAAFAGAELAQRAN